MTNISSLKLPPRISKSLISDEIDTMEEIAQMPEEALLSLTGVGFLGLGTIKRALAVRGIDLPQGLHTITLPTKVTIKELDLTPLQIGHLQKRGIKTAMQLRNFLMEGLAREEKPREEWTLRDFRAPSLSQRLFIDGKKALVKKFAELNSNRS